MNFILNPSIGIQTLIDGVKTYGGLIDSLES
jgi:hypothetical protein